jgi:lipid-binding SYLF domain-containing protein
MKRIARRLAIIFAALLIAAPAFAGEKEDARANNAVRVLREIQKIPENSIPDKLLDQGRAIIVIPETVKAGFVIGGRRGHGLMSVKNPDGTWSQPVFIKLTGGSIGFQAGVESSDVVLVFRNDRSLNNIVNGKFTIGGDASVAAGPVGRNAAAATDGQLKAEIWSWSRARGLFAGVALDGAVLQIDRPANAAVYGANATPRAIFESRAGAPSNAVVAFRDELEEATATARANRSGSVNNAARPVVTAGTPVASPTTQTQAAQGFEPVDGGAVKTEPLNGTP